MQGEARERERKNINQSLLTLGRVISTLKECMEKKISTENVRIPYRDSAHSAASGVTRRTMQDGDHGYAFSECAGCRRDLLDAQLRPAGSRSEQARGYLIPQDECSSLTDVVRCKGWHSGDGGRAQGLREMECRLQYMQSQVDEAQSTLARKHL